MFEINPGLILWTIITFVVLAALLSRFAWRPMLSALKQREETIRDAVEQAARARDEAAALIKTNQENMAKAEEEYQKLMRDARSMAEKVREEIVTKAQEQARNDLARAQEEIRRNIDEARQQLRVEVADLAIKAAEKILDESLDAAKQKKLVDGFINQLPKN